MAVARARYQVGQLNRNQCVVRHASSRSVGRSSRPVTAHLSSATIRRTAAPLRGPGTKAVRPNTRRRSVTQASVLDPFTVVHEVEHAYRLGVSELEQYPSVVRGLASVCTYGIGDVLAQKKPLDELNQRRLKSFMISGFGAGVLWGWWYDCLEHALTSYGVSPGWRTTIASLTIEQFVWAPLFFGLYFLPLTGVLKGKDTKGVLAEVGAELGPTLWANAQVWTFLNVVIYNVPLPIRPFVSNLGDILWSAYLSLIVQDDETRKGVEASMPHPHAHEMQEEYVRLLEESLELAEPIRSQVVPISISAMEQRMIMVGERERVFNKE